MNIVDSLKFQKPSKWYAEFVIDLKLNCNKNIYNWKHTNRTSSINYFKHNIFKFLNWKAVFLEKKKKINKNKVVMYID